MYFVFIFASLFALISACGAPDQTGGTAEQSSEDSSEESLDASLFDGVYNSSEIDGSDIIVPLTNGKAVARVSDGVIGLYADGGDNYLATLTGSGELTTQLIANGVSPGTLTALKDAVLAVTQLDTGSQRQMKATWSTDGGKTGSDLDLGDKGVGPAVPSACLWQEGSDVKGLVAWVAPPTEEDGGPLYVVELTNGIVGTVQQVGSEEGFSAPTLSCSSDGRFMAVRSQPDADTEITIHFGERVNGSFSLKEVFKGADPSLCVAGNHAWIGSHRGAQANLSHSTDDGNTWDTTELDASARFVSVSCFENKIIAFYGKWPDTPSAVHHDSATRQAIGKFSNDGGKTFVTHQPAGTEGNQTSTSVIMDSEGIAIVLKDSSRQTVRIFVD